MSISAEEREQFVVFMRQGWVKQFCADAVIYSLETGWLKPYHPLFYVGVTVLPRAEN